TEEAEEAEPTEEAEEAEPAEEAEEAEPTEEAEEAEPSEESMEEEPASPEEAGEEAEEEVEPEPEPEPKPKLGAPGGLGKPKAAPLVPAPRAPKTEPVAGPEDAFRRLGLTRQAREDEVKALVDLATDAKQNGDLVRAEGYLEQALALDPRSARAQTLLSEVRLLLGDTSGQVPGITRWYTGEIKVQQDQAVTEIRRLIQEAAALREKKDYERAQTLLERSIESIRHFPFHLNLEADLRQAQSMLETVKAERAQADEEERQRYLSLIREKGEADRRENEKYLENQVRQLRRRAEEAEKEGKYERAITYWERLSDLQPKDREIARRLARAREERHARKMGEYIQRAMDNYREAVVGIEESSIVYQQIFRYPDAREWVRITPKVVTVEEELAATESAAEKEIRRKLEDAYEIGFEEGVPLKEALSALQSLSGVNFVLNKDGAAAAETDVKLPRLELPLRSILNLILGGAGEEFGYTIKEGAVVIGPKASLKQRLYLRFYEVSDLIRVRPDYKAPRVALSALQGRQEAAGAASLALGAPEEVPSGTRIGTEKLLEILHKELGIEEGTGDESVRILSGKLAARTTIENHLKLAQLLEQFREAAGMMVTVESRFLDIQDNLLEEIGIDFGSANASFLANAIPDIDGSGTSVAPGYEYIDPSGSPNVRVASIGSLSQPLGSKVNPFNLSSSGGGAFQFNVLKAERYQLEALLTAVSKEQEIRRLNSPRVTAFNGQIAHTMVVNQAAYIQDLEVNQTGVIPVVNPVIDVLNSGSILEVRPTVGYDRKYVMLEIQPQLAEKLDSDRAVLNLSGNFTVVPVELPVLSVTTIKTTVTVPDGGTVLVGGLKREIMNKAQIGVPGLLDIPILNLLSGRKGLAKLRSNLFVLLNAKITMVKEEEERVFGAGSL
ncbi:MAG: hypothetical protein ACUVYA_05260, partial [Planctomycetota bacterium]